MMSGPQIKGGNFYAKKRTPDKKMPALKWPRKKEKRLLKIFFWPTYKP
jgi:hypothetical protein